MLAPGTCNRSVVIGAVEFIPLPSMQFISSDGWSRQNSALWALLDRHDIRVEGLLAGLELDRSFGELSGDGIDEALPPGFRRISAGVDRHRSHPGRVDAREDRLHHVLGGLTGHHDAIV